MTFLLPSLNDSVWFDTATHRYELGLLDFGDSVIIAVILFMHVCTHLTGSFVTFSGFTVTVCSPCCMVVFEAFINHCVSPSSLFVRLIYGVHFSLFRPLTWVTQHTDVGVWGAFITSDTRGSIPLWWNVTRNQLHTARSYRFMSHCRDLDCVHPSRREVTDEAFAVSRPTKKKNLLCSK